MIELFVSLVLPFMQFLEDPQLRYDEAVQRIEGRLQTIHVSSADEEAQKMPAVVSEKYIPPVSGRLLQAHLDPKVLETSTTQHMVSEQLLRLTGVIEADGQRVGIVTNGQQDLVVGVGSYVFGAFKVLEVGHSDLMMSRLNAGKKSAGPVTLKLNGESGAEVN